MGELVCRLTAVFPFAAFVCVHVLGFFLRARAQAAVAGKNYKEAGAVNLQIKETERRQQEVMV